MRAWAIRRPRHQKAQTLSGREHVENPFLEFGQIAFNGTPDDFLVNAEVLVNDDALTAEPPRPAHVHGLGVAGLSPSRRPPGAEATFQDRREDR